MFDAENVYILCRNDGTLEKQYLYETKERGNLKVVLKYDRIVLTD